MTAWRSPKRSIIGRDEFGRTLSVKSSPGFYTIPYAVPFVSAAAGVLLSSYPELDTKAVQAMLEESTLDLGQPGRDPTFGFGLIQMASLCPGPAEPLAITTAHESPLAAPLGEQAAKKP